MTHRVCSVIALVLACSEPPRRLGHPMPPLDATQVASMIFTDFQSLADMAQRLRGQCVELTADLQALMPRLQHRKGEVDRLMRDPKQAAELKTELAAYADRTKALTDKIATNLAATYLTCCPETAGPKPEIAADDDSKRAPKVRTSCETGYQLERAIAGIPTY